MIALAQILGVVAYCASIAFTVPRMWEWFVHPLGVPLITGWHALGLTALKQTLWQGPLRNKHERDTDEEGETAIHTWARVLLVWLSFGLALLWKAGM